jgi:hypothetical protein
MNWKKTEEYYLKEGYVYPPNREKGEHIDPRQRLIIQKKPEQVELDNWEKRVIDPITKQFKQRQGDSTVYPIRRLIQCKRIRATDGHEYLCGFWEYIAVDGLGNRRTTTVQNPEMHIRPEFVKELRGTRENPEPHYEIVSVEENERVYDLLFTPENLDDILKGQDVRRISFIAAEDFGNGPVRPLQIQSLDDFRNKTFDELYKFTPIPDTGYGQGQQQGAAAAAKRR